MKNLISLKEYLDKKKIFVIPNYQRGYIWGKSRGTEKNSVDYLLETIKKGFPDSEGIFLQGVTVSETEREIELIDGQQRTTFFYLLLHYLQYQGQIEIKYSVRKESESFLTELNGKDWEAITALIAENTEEKYQDIFFFKKTLRIINEKLAGEDKNELLTFILDKVRFLYINIPKEKAVKTFTMMNGSKAIMLPEELIKAEVLRQISLPKDNTEKESLSEEELIAEEWEINALRSRYAREWDKWLYWWNREDVQYLFKTKNPMGLLLKYYYRRETGDRKEFNFENFKSLLSSSKNTKRHFKGLRNLQKSFEDIFNDPIVYNNLGISLKDAGDDYFNIINFFIDNKHNPEELSNLTKWRVVGATFRQITKPEELRKDEGAKEETREDKAELVREALSQKFVYNSDGDGYARKYLLYLNILEDNRSNDGKGDVNSISLFSISNRLNTSTQNRKRFTKEKMEIIIQEIMI